MLDEYPAVAERVSAQPHRVDRHRRGPLEAVVVVDVGEALRRIGDDRDHLGCDEVVHQTAAAIRPEDRVPVRRELLRLPRERLQLPLHRGVTHPDESRWLEIPGRRCPPARLEHLTYVRLRDDAGLKTTHGATRADEGGRIHRAHHGSTITLSAPSTRSLNVRSAPPNCLSGELF